jgi:hypothetical protein
VCAIHDFARRIAIQQQTPHAMRGEFLAHKTGDTPLGVLRRLARISVMALAISIAPNSR